MRAVRCTSALIAVASSRPASLITRTLMIQPWRAGPSTLYGASPAWGRIMTKYALFAAVGALTVAASLMPASAADPAAVTRGKYLVAIAGCNDCHTPGYFFGKADM